MAWIFAAMTLFGVIAAVFLPWYDNPKYHTEIYGIQGPLGFFISCLRWITVASGVLTAILMIIASRVEPKDAGLLRPPSVCHEGKGAQARR
jgi:hypothetical protein